MSKYFDANYKLLISYRFMQRIKMLSKVAKQAQRFDLYLLVVTLHFIWIVILITCLKGFRNLLLFCTFI